MVTEKFQIDFIRYLSRIFKEGDFSATYKHAFLNALADISIEMPLEISPVVSVRDVTEKMVELYWRQSQPFSGDDKFLLQNTDRQCAIISNIISMQENGYSLGSLKKDRQIFDKFISNQMNAVKNGPLWRLQRLSRKEESFLYVQHKGSQTIRLNDGVQECFQIYYDLVVTLCRDRWQQMIRSIPKNFELVGKKGDLENFLFGTQRKSLKEAQKLLRELQNDRCFYCCRHIQKEKMAVDHFIPWARYPNDLGHNFVLAHESCNSSKRDFLADNEKFLKWKESNLDLFKDEIEVSLSDYFLCDAERSLAVANWAYANNSAPLWVK